MRSHFDVIIIGGGAMGTSSAYYLSQDRRVLLIEQFEFGHSNGSSHGKSRIIRKSYQEEFYAKMMEKAYSLWMEIENKIGIKVIHKTGGLDFGRNKEVINKIAENCKITNTLYELLSGIEIKKKFPAFNIPDDFYGVYQKDAGILNPDEILPLMRKIAEKNGAVLNDNEKLISINRGDNIEIVTNRDTYTADKIVITAGSWMMDILADLKLTNINIWQLVFTYLKYNTANFKDFPIFIYWDDNIFYGFPEFEKDGYIKVAPHFTNNSIININDRENVPNSELENHILDFTSNIFPDLDNNPKQTSNCLYTMTIDENFIIDKHPKDDRIIICGGFSGHGFKFVSLIGKIVADLIIKNNCEIDLSNFKISKYIE